MSSDLAVFRFLRHPIGAHDASGRDGRIPVGVLVGRSQRGDAWFRGKAHLMVSEPWGQQLKRWRTVAGFGRAKLARVAQVSERNIANLEERDQRPSAATIRALTDALTSALVGVEGSWTTEQRAIFAAGPVVHPTGGQQVVDPGQSANAPLFDSRTADDPPALTTTAVAALPVGADAIPAPATLLVEDPTTTTSEPAADDVVRLPRRRLLASALVAVVVVAALVVVVLNGQGESPVSSGEFATPEPDSRVASPLDVRGSASVAADDELWLLLKSRNNSFYTVTNEPAPITVDANGDWTVHTVGVGKDADDVGKRYELYLVASPRGGSLASAVQEKPPERHSVGFAELPTDTTVLDSVAIQLSGL